METFEFLLGAFLQGFESIYNELTHAWRYSLPTIGASVSAGVLICWLSARLTKRGFLTWTLAGATVAVVSAIVRPALVFGAPVLRLQGVDCFTLFGIQPTTYVLFALSGALAGCLIGRLSRLAVIARLDRDSEGDSLRVVKTQTGIRMAIPGSLFVTLGVLYHFGVAQHFYTADLIPRAVLFVIEFFAPTCFAFLGTVVGAVLLPGKQ